MKLDDTAVSDAEHRQRAVRVQQFSTCAQCILVDLLLSKIIFYHYLLPFAVSRYITFLVNTSRHSISVFVQLL